MTPARLPCNVPNTTGDGSHDEDARRCGCDSCAFEEDADAWLDSMTGATDWGLVRWGTGEDSILAY